MCVGSWSFGLGSPQSVPTDFGDARAGTIKADEWRTLATVYIPLALVSLWGEGSHHQSAEEEAKLRTILDNTMYLVSAIRIACSSTMTESQVLAYRSCITTWLKTLPDVLPEATIHPNCHMACHIYDYLKLFGPVWLWWCFPFERPISHLQRLPLNDKFGEPCVHFTSDYGVSNSFVGEMEQTALHVFIHSARLKLWFARADHPPAISACKELFDKYVQPGNAKSSYSSAVSKERPASSCTPSDSLPIMCGSTCAIHIWQCCC